ncbi:hypothetical protein [Pseudomonas putida]|uniref:hypothetical protein n=1 Tax=Pseudomonas putida TaxID=303 RepID=UPI003D33B9D6
MQFLFTRRSNDLEHPPARCECIIGSVVPVLPVLKLLIGKILPIPVVRTSLIGIQMLINGVAMPLRLTIRASPMVHGAR